MMIQATSFIRLMASRGEIPSRHGLEAEDQEGRFWPTFVMGGGSRKCRPFKELLHRRHSFKPAKTLASGTATIEIVNRS
jgi:hypothetical protein